MLWQDGLFKIDKTFLNVQTFQEQQTVPIKLYHLLLFKACSDNNIYDLFI